MATDIPPTLQQDPTEPQFVELTQTPSPRFETILESHVTPDADLTIRIVRSLSNKLGVSMNRIQIVTIESAQWHDENLGCDVPSNMELDIAAATFQPDTLIDGYRYLLLVGNTTHEVHTQGTGRFISCTDDGKQIEGDLLLAVDPIALDLVQLVKRLVADELDLSTRRIQLQQIAAYTWQDTSLGCPYVDQTYDPASIPGYRIVVTVGTNTHVFHSDSISIFPCPIGQEDLPE